MHPKQTVNYFWLKNEEQLSVNFEQTFHLTSKSNLLYILIDENEEKQSVLIEFLMKCRVFDYIFSHILQESRKHSNREVETILNEFLFALRVVWLVNKSILGDSLQASQQILQVDLKKISSVANDSSKNFNKTQIDLYRHVVVLKKENDALHCIKPKLLIILLKDVNQLEKSKWSF